MKYKSGDLTKDNEISDIWGIPIYEFIIKGYGEHYITNWGEPIDKFCHHSENTEKLMAKTSVLLTNIFTY